MVSPGRCIVFLVGLLAVGATLVSSCAGLSSDRTSTSAGAVLNGAAFEPAASLPAGLSFARTDGVPFTTADTRGRLSLFFFGYTHCADVCPLTLAQLTQMRKTLGADAASVDMYFVTTDPARDTAERMQTYMENFPGVVGLTGATDDLARLQTAFGVVAQRHALPNGDYMIDHTAAVYLVNAQSKIQLVYPDGTPTDDIAADVQQLARRST